MHSPPHRSSPTIDQALDFAAFRTRYPFSCQSIASPAQAFEPSRRDGILVHGYLYRPVVDPIANPPANLPLRGAKGWLYEGGIRVPMILQYPASQGAGRVCDLPVINNDLYPTILKLANLPTRAKQHCDGVSLAGLIKGTSSSLKRHALYWHFPHYSNHGMQSPCVAVRA